MIIIIGTHAQVASQAVGAMPSILMFPIFPFFIEAGLIVYWLCVTAMIYTCGELAATCRNPADRPTFSLAMLKDANMSTFTTSSTVDCYQNVTGWVPDWMCMRG